MLRRTKFDSTDSGMLVRVSARMHGLKVALRSKLLACSPRRHTLWSYGQVETTHRFVEKQQNPAMGALR